MEEEYVTGTTTTLVMEEPLRWRERGEHKTMKELPEKPEVEMLRSLFPGLYQRKNFVPSMTAAGVFGSGEMRKAFAVVPGYDLSDETKSAESVRCGVVKGEDQRTFLGLAPEEENPDRGVFFQVHGSIDPLSDCRFVI